MTYKKVKKWSHVLLLVYLVLAITGSFAFQMREAFCFDKLNTNRLNSAFFLSSIVHTVEWLAENTSNSALRNGYLCLFLFAGIQAATIKIARSYLLVMKNDDTSIIRNTNLIKLRI